MMIYYHSILPVLMNLNVASGAGKKREISRIFLKSEFLSAGRVTVFNDTPLNCN